VPHLPAPAGLSRAAGARFLKLFPASALGPGYVQGLLGPYPQLELVVVGGVMSANLLEYLRAGAIGAGVGARAGGREADGFAGAAEEARRLRDVLEGTAKPVASRRRSCIVALLRRERHGAGGGRAGQDAGTGGGPTLANFPEAEPCQQCSDLAGLEHRHRGHDAYATRMA
jgi:hypothetical protein